MEKPLIRTELYNLLTGLFLVVAAIIDLSRGDISMALSWGIFGAMYLVMDDYSYNEGKQKTLLEKSTHLSRVLFGPIGALLSFVLVIYYVLSM